MKQIFFLQTEKGGKVNSVFIPFSFFLHLSLQILDLIFRLSHSALAKKLR